MVAGESFLRYRLASRREPTGCAESMYSRIRAMRTSRCRSSIKALVATGWGQVKMSGLQELHEQRVGDEEPGFAESDARAGPRQQPGALPVVDPPLPGGVAGQALGEPSRRNAVGGAEPEDQALAEA